MRAFELISTHRSIEEILDHLDKEKYPVPENFNFQGARELFRSPSVVDASSLEVIVSVSSDNGLVKMDRTKCGRDFAIFGG